MTQQLSLREQDGDTEWQPSCLQLSRHSPFVELHKLLAPRVRESGTLVGTHQRPITVRLYSLHKQVGNPEGVEQVPRSLLVLTCSETEGDTVKERG